MYLFDLSCSSDVVHTSDIARVVLHVFFPRKLRQSCSIATFEEYMERLDSPLSLNTIDDTWM